MRRPEEGAAAARKAAQGLGDLLYEKQLAYGDSGAIALGLWLARLEQYTVATVGRTPGQVWDDVDTIMSRFPGSAFVVLPQALLAHIPRVTRLDDRINRLVSNPGADRLGEDPWLDAAGDCIVGHVSPRLPAAPRLAPEELALLPDAARPCLEPNCELDAHDPDEMHRRVHAGGVVEW